MEENNYLELSRDFWDNYKLFLKQEINLAELKTHLVTADDVKFYHDECDSKCDVATILKSVAKRNLDILIDGFFSVLEATSDTREKKAVARKILMIFISNYSSLTREKTVKSKASNLMMHFASPFEAVNENLYLDLLINNLILTVFSLKDKQDIEGMVNLVLFKFISFYSCLGVSDKEGRIRCNDLGKELSSNWNVSTPESVTLSILKKRERNSKDSLSELKILEKYSFWIKKRSRSFLWLHFLI